MIYSSFSDIRTRLTFLILIAILPALVLMIYSGMEQRSTAINQAKVEALAIAKNISRLQKHQIDDMRQVLFTLSKLPQVRHRNNTACMMIFAALLENSSGYTGFAAVLPNGDVFTSAPAITKPVNFSDRAWFNCLVKTRDLVIGDYSIGRISGKATIIVGYPVLDDQGQIQTVLAVGLDLEWLNTFIDTLDLPMGTTVKIFDRNGTVLLSSYGPEKLIGKSLPDTAIVAKLLAEKNGTAQGIGLDGTPRLYGFTSLNYDQSAIYELIGIPEKIAFGPAIKAMIRNIVLLGFATVLALLLAWLAAEFLIARPANMVLTATRKIADGDLSARTGMDSGTGELAQIAHGFDLMADALQAHEVERKADDVQLRKINRALRTLSRTNEIVIHATKETDLLEAICSTLVHVGEYCMAWIGFSEQNEGKGIRPVAYAGFEQGYLESLNLTWADTEKGRGPTGTAIRTGTPSVCNDILSNPKFATWRDEAIKLGYESFASLPLVANDETIGALSLYAEQKDAFDQEELQLLTELSNDLAFGISHIRLGVERNQAEKALQQSKERYKELYVHTKKSEELYRSIIDASPDAIVIYDLQGRTQFVSPMFTRIFEWTSAEIKDKRIPFVPETEKQRTMKTIRAVVEDGTPCIGFETRRSNKSGRVLDVSISASRYDDHQGNPIGTIAILRDISERKKMEKQLLQAQKMESVGRLAGGVAHDYNNMLSVIIGYAELALDKVEPDEPLHADLEEILAAGKRSADITRQLLAFARQQTVAPKVLDLNESVESMLKMLRRLIGEDIDLAWHPRKGLWPVKMDPTQIDQILANLCVNARDAITDVGKITIETDIAAFDKSYCAEHAYFVPGEYVMLAVSDDGCGMDNETLDKLFEPFFTTKEGGRGTGLGLATVYGIVKQNEGFINVYSESGKGTTFRIYLSKHVGQGVEAQKTSVGEVPNGHGETVLVVEDEASVLKLTEKILSDLDYRVILANTPAEALQLVEADIDDLSLLITDVVMPEMNGRELAERLQLLYPNLKCLFMSGYTANVIAHRGVLEDGVNFIQKPFSQKDMAIKVRRALDNIKT